MMQRIRSLHSIAFSQQLQTTQNSKQAVGEDVSSPAGQSQAYSSGAGQDPRGHTWQKGVRLPIIRLYYWLMTARRVVCPVTLLLLILLGWLLLKHTPSGKASQQQTHYSVYIDAGSSGTRAHVFEYSLSPWPAYVHLVLPESTFAVEPGLSTYSGRPEMAATSLLPLLEYVYEHVPEHLWHLTPIHLLATAGLRMLDPGDAEDMLVACRKVLASSHLAFQGDWARIIPGQAEGLYAWTAVNYVSGSLEEAALHHHHSRKEILQVSSLFKGVLELGGASLQITFMPAHHDSIVELNGTVVPLPGVTGRIFTHSYLGLGMETAVHRVADLVLAKHRQLADEQEETQATPIWDPCLPSGFQADDGRMGSANFNACMAVVQQVLPPRVCLPVSHELGSSRQDEATDGRGSRGTSKCTFAGVHIPAVLGAEFVGIENFFWTARALGLGPDATLAALRVAGEVHCARSWTSLHGEFAGHVPTQFVTRYCFGACYVYALLHHRLGLNPHTSVVKFTNTIRRRTLVGRPGLPSFDAPTTDGVSSGLGATTGEVEVGLSWVVGAMLVQAMTTGRQGSLGFWHHQRGSTGLEEGQEEQSAGDMRLLFLLLGGVPIMLAAVLVYMRSQRTKTGKVGKGSTAEQRLEGRGHCAVAVHVGIQEMPGLTDLPRGYGMTPGPGWQQQSRIAEEPSSQEQLQERQGHPGGSQRDENDGWSSREQAGEKHLTH